MATSVIPAVLSYLVATFTNAATLGAAPAPNTVTVFDGPVVALNSPFLALWVGVDDPDQAAPKAAGSTSVWAALGRQARNEQITVYCCAEAWSALDDPLTGISTLRTAVYGITNAVETLIRADGTLGGNVQTPGNAAVSVMDLQQKTDTGKGTLARVPFVITAQARI